MSNVLNTQKVQSCFQAARLRVPQFFRMTACFGLLAPLRPISFQRKFGCPKIARRCETKHIFKSKCKKFMVLAHFWKFRCRKFAPYCGAKHFANINVQDTSASDFFLKFGCRKIARRCREKHICKSKCLKNDGIPVIF